MSSSDKVLLSKLRTSNYNVTGSIFHGDGSTMKYNSSSVVTTKGGRDECELFGNEYDEYELKLCRISEGVLVGDNPEFNSLKELVSTEEKLLKEINRLRELKGGKTLNFIHNCKAYYISSQEIYEIFHNGGDRIHIDEQLPVQLKDRPDESS